VSASSVAKLTNRFSISGTLFGLTILSLLAASTRQPGRPDPTLTPEGAREAQERKEWDEDDIPLGRLRKGRRHDLRLSSAPHVGRTSTEGSLISSSGSSGYSPKVSPFPLNVSPLVPTTASDAGEDTREAGEIDDFGSGNPLVGEDIQGGDGEGDEGRLLAASQQDSSAENRKSIFAKNSSGGHRWCSKCDAWKPDRCHHCRICKRCTLKSKSTLSKQYSSEANTADRIVDHHCIWIGTCVGYHNCTCPILPILILLTIRQAFPTFCQLRYPTITFDLHSKRFEYDPLPHSPGG